MAMPTFDEVLTRARRQLQDTGDNPRWTDDELSGWIDDGQRHYVEETGVLRSQAPISVKENEDVYTWPEDCMRVIRIENNERYEVTPTTSGELQRREGGKYREVEGTPQEYYSDLDGPGSFRFYPKADPSFEADNVDFAENETVLRDLSIGLGEDLHAVDRDDAYLYLLGTDYIHKVKIETWSIESQTAHGITLGVTFQRPRFIKKVPDAEVVVWAENTTIRKTTLGGATTSLETIVNDAIGGISPFIGDNYMFWETNTLGTTKVCYVADYTSAGSKSALSTVTFFHQAVVNDAPTLTESGWSTAKWYAACGSSGIYKITSTGGTETQVSSDTCYGIASAKVVAHPTDTKAQSKRCYLNMAGTLSYIEIGLNYESSITDTDYTDLPSTYGTLYANEGTGTIWYEEGQLNIKKLNSDYDEVEQSWFIEQIAVAASGLGALVGAVVTNEDDMFVIFPLPYSRSWLMTTDEDAGVVCWIDDNVAPEDTGLLVNYNETDDVVTFTRETGVVTSAFDATDIAQVFYVREPLEGLHEIDDDEALAAYACAKALEIESDSENMQRSLIWLEKFTRRMNRAKRGQSRLWTKSHQKNKTNYY